MSQFDNLRENAQEQLQQHGDQVEGVSDQGLDKGGDALDSATGGKFSDQIDQGQERADDAIGSSDDSTTDSSGESQV
jgi:MT0933-like antitoxin protein